MRCCWSVGWREHRVTNKVIISQAPLTPACGVDHLFLIVCLKTGRGSSSGGIRGLKRRWSISKMTRHSDQGIPCVSISLVFILIAFPNRKRCFDTIFRRHNQPGRVSLKSRAFFYSSDFIKIESQQSSTSLRRADCSALKKELPLRRDAVRC